MICAQPTFALFHAEGMQAQCVECDHGYQCADGIPRKCERGKYSDGSGACQECKAGHFCSEDSTSKEEMEQQKCPAGVYCPEGTDSVPVLATHPCPAGSYCPEVSFSMFVARRLNLRAQVNDTTLRAGVTLYYIFVMQVETPTLSPYDLRLVFPSKGLVRVPFCISGEV